MASNYVVRAALTKPTSATTPADVTESMYVGDLDPKTVMFQASGTAASTFKYEVSLDKSSWFQVGDDLVETTAFADLTMMNDPGDTAESVVGAVWARLRCSAFTSIASIKFVVAGVPLA